MASLDLSETSIMEPKGLRILLLAPESNPNSITGPLIGYFHGEALARLHRVTLVVKERNAEAIRNADGGFHAVEAVSATSLDRVHAWIFKRIFKEDWGNLLFNALSFPLPIAFELKAWKQLRNRIKRGEFDVVLRILPIVPTAASPFAFFLRKGPIPFVIGPLNGGVPWPTGFSQLARQRATAGNWVAGLRKFYRFLPFARSTYADAAAIIVGSSHAFQEFAEYRDKVFCVPGENGVRAAWLQRRAASVGRDGRRLELTFVGRLVPYKACDLALRGAASLLRAGRAHLSILGDGPERVRLEELAIEFGVADEVTFLGSVDHAEVLLRLSKSDVLLFPSLREFGGGVVFEALAMGAVPVVADYGGPGDIVTDSVGYRIPLTNEHEMASRMQDILEHLASNRQALESLRQKGPERVREHLTWDAKARQVTEVLQWAVGTGPKPVMLPPKCAA